MNWVIVTTVRESDFMSQINANTRTTILLCLATLILAIAIGILTARLLVPFSELLKLLNKLLLVTSISE